MRIRSLRARFVLALAAVLMPLVLSTSAAIAYFLPAVLAPMEKILAEVTEEMEPVRRLQLSLLAAALAAHEGGAQFAAHRALIEEAYRELAAASDLDPSERALMQAAYREWQEAYAVYSSASSKASAQTRAQTAAARAEYAASILEGFIVETRDELKRNRRKAQIAMQRDVWIAISALLLALAVSVYAGLRLVRPLLRDTDSLRHGAVRLADGELSHRVGTPSTLELRELATAFNAMGERIQADVAALAELATRDALTGLLNRREFLRLLRDELSRARRYGRPFALLLLDADHFKRVNDSWGHPAGDDVLRAIAGRIMNEIRPTDRAARYGGEEFSVLLAETDIGGALAVAERLRAAIAAQPVVTAAGQAIAVTASIGVAAYPQAGPDEQALIAAADRNLYSAKSAGRNRAIAA